MRYIDLTKNGGLPLTQDMLDYLQIAYTELFTAIGSLIGTKMIVAGMEVGSGSVSEGWFVFNGELIKFNASSINTKVKITESLSSVVFEDGLNKSVYKIKTASCDGNGDFDFSELKRASSFTTELKAKYDGYFLTGDIKEIDCTQAYIDANFDATGLGRNERLGWAICNGQNGTKNRGGRVSIGYDANTIDPNNNVWDAAYNIIGNVGGERAHKLTKNESGMPDHSINIILKEANTGGNNFAQAAGNNKDTATINISGKNADESHENRPPFIVTLFIQKI